MQSFTKNFIILNFSVNKKYIAKNLCVKKDVKNNCCQGKCHLKKQLNEEENDTKKSSSNNLKEKSEELFAEKEFNFYFNNNKIFSLEFPLKSNAVAFLLSTNIFHPPCLV